MHILRNTNMGKYDIMEIMDYYRNGGIMNIKENFYIYLYNTIIH
jgi:hypothetical protein